MRHILRKFICICALAPLGTLLIQSARSEEHPDPRLEKILAEWQQRQNWFQAVEYQVRGTFKVPRGAYSRAPSFPTVAKRRKAKSKVNPPRDVEGPENLTVLLEFDKGRHRRDIHEQQFNLSTGRLTPLAMKDAFNGSTMKCLIPKEENPNHQVSVTQPELTITSGNMKNGAFKVRYYPIFFGHGRLYTAMEPILPGQLRNKPNPDYLYIHGTGVQDNRPCLIVRSRTLQMSSTSFDEYWVDVEEESAIVRYLTYSGKKPAVEMKIRYRMSHSHWLPHSWTRTVYVLGKELYHEDMRVEKITINPPLTDADFEVGDIKPRMLIEEGIDLPTNHPLTTPKSKFSVYRVKSDGGRDYIRNPARREGDQYVARHTRGEQIWLIAVFLIAGGIGVGIWLKKRRTAAG